MTGTARVHSDQSTPTGEPVNAALRAHEESVLDWRHRELAGVFHSWAERFAIEFKLDIPTPAIQLDHIRATALGTYRAGRNGFGLRHEVTINTRFLSLPLAEQLLTLFHELIHEWQDIHGSSGKRNYHNNEFQQKACDFGLLVDKRGMTQTRIGLFTNLLVRECVDVAPLLTTGPVPTHKRPGKSKMRKWRCGCTNVRCAVTLQAHCSRCEKAFQEAVARW